MSEQGALFGCIYGVGLVVPISRLQEFYQHNRDTIAALDEKVDWQNNILVVRNMFTVPMPEMGAGFYRYQMIHFAASFNHLDSLWSTWLEQFEALLRKLYWLEAYVYMEAEGFAGHTQYHWQAHLGAMWENPPRPVETWDFTGGPRDFPYP